MESDLFLEMLEVYINSILYLREVYPAAIFRKRRVYSSTAFISIFPALNDYLLNTLKTAQALKAQNKLFQVELIIYQKEFDLFGTPEDEEVLERYVFRMENDENSGKDITDLPLYILQFEEQLRKGLIDLDKTAKHLKRLDPQYVGFRIHLETTQAAFVDIVNKDNSKSEVNDDSQLKLINIKKAILILIFDHFLFVYRVFHGSQHETTRNRQSGSCSRF